MKATVRFTTGVRDWRDYGAGHMQATLSLAGLALDGIQVEIRAGSVAGVATVSGEALDGPKLAALLGEHCRLDEVQVIPHEPLSNSPHPVGREPAGEEPVVEPVLGRGYRGKRKVVKE